MPITPSLKVEINQEVTITQSVMHTGGTLPVGTVGKVINPRTWQGNITVGFGDVVLSLAPSYFVHKSSPIPPAPS